jgi:hypothetical protein
VCATADRVPSATPALLAEFRRRAVPAYVGTAPLAPDNPDLAARLYDLMVTLATMCRFDRTGDIFLVTAIRAMLPSSAVASLEVGETPYAISKHALEDSNTRIGSLFRRSPVEVLESLAASVFSTTKLCLMMAVAAEYLPRLAGAPPLYVNGDIGPAGGASNAIFVCDNFDCGAGDTIVVACPGNPQSFTCVSTALAFWAQTDPRAADLHLALTAPETLDPASVFRRILSLE